MPLFKTFQKRTTAGCVLAVLLFQELFFPALGLADSTPIFAQTTLVQPAAFHAKDFSISEDHAFIQEVYEGTLGRSVILIQDAHANFSGQLNLSKTLDDVIQKYGIRQVLVEGGQGPASLSWIRNLVPEKTLKSRAKNLLARGEISGEEYLNLASKHSFSLIGMEDESLYRRGLRAYERLRRHRENTLAWLSRARQMTQKMKYRLYPKDLLDYEEALSQDALSAWPRLLGLSTEQDLAAHPQAARLKALFNAPSEVSIKFPERAGQELVLEEDSLRRSVFGRRLADPSPRALAALDEYWALLEEGFSARISRPRYEKLKASQNDFPMDLSVAFLNRLLSERDLGDGALSVPDWEREALESLEDFYASAHERDQAFVQSAERVKDACFVMIAGGYHSEHLARLFREAGYSYAILSPRVEHPTSQSKYERLLLGESKTARFDSGRRGAQQDLIRQPSADTRPDVLHSLLYGVPSGARFASGGQEDLLKEHYLDWAGECDAELRSRLSGWLNDSDIQSVADALQHLRANAFDAARIRFKDEAEKKMRLSLELGMEGGDLILTVSDNGTGMNQVVLRHWMAYFQTEKRGPESTVEAHFRPYVFGKGGIGALAAGALLKSVLSNPRVTVLTRHALGSFVKSFRAASDAETIDNAPIRPAPSTEDLGTQIEIRIPLPNLAKDKVGFKPKKWEFSGVGLSQASEISENLSDQPDQESRASSLAADWNVQLLSLVTLGSRLADRSENAFDLFVKSALGLQRSWQVYFIGLSEAGDSFYHLKMNSLFSKKNWVFQVVRGQSPALNVYQRDSKVGAQGGWVQLVYRPGTSELDGKMFERVVESLRDQAIAEWRLGPDRETTRLMTGQPGSVSEKREIVFDQKRQFLLRLNSGDALKQWLQEETGLSVHKMPVQPGAVAGWAQYVLTFSEKQVPAVVALQGSADDAAIRVRYEGQDLAPFYRSKSPEPFAWILGRLEEEAWINDSHNLTRAVFSVISDENPKLHPVLKPNHETHYRFRSTIGPVTIVVDQEPRLRVEFRADLSRFTRSGSQQVVMYIDSQSPEADQQLGREILAWLKGRLEFEEKPRQRMVDFLQEFLIDDASVAATKQFIGDSIVTLYRVVAPGRNEAIWVLVDPKAPRAIRVLAERAGKPTPFDRADLDQTQEPESVKVILERLTDLDEMSKRFLKEYFREVIAALGEINFFYQQYRNFDSIVNARAWTDKDILHYLRMHVFLLTKTKRLTLTMTYDSQRETLLFKPSAQHPKAPKSDLSGGEPLQHIQDAARMKRFIQFFRNQAAVSGGADLTRLSGFGGLEHLLSLSKAESGRDISLAIQETNSPLQLVSSQGTTPSRRRALALVFSLDFLQKRYQLQVNGDHLKLLSEDGISPKNPEQMSGETAKKLIQDIESHHLLSANRQFGARLSAGTSDELDTFLEDILDLSSPGPIFSIEPEAAGGKYYLLRSSPKSSREWVLQVADGQEPAFYVYERDSAGGSPSAWSQVAYKPGRSRRNNERFARLAQTLDSRAAYSWRPDEQNPVAHLVNGAFVSIIQKGEVISNSDGRWDFVPNTGHILSGFLQDPRYFVRKITKGSEPQNVSERYSLEGANGLAVIVTVYESEDDPSMQVQRGGKNLSILSRSTDPALFDSLRLRLREADAANNPNGIVQSLFDLMLKENPRVRINENTEPYKTRFDFLLSIGEVGLVFEEYPKRILRVWADLSGIAAITSGQVVLPLHLQSSDADRRLGNEVLTWLRKQALLSDSETPPQKTLEFLKTLLRENVAVAETSQTIGNALVRLYRIASPKQHGAVWVLIDPSASRSVRVLGQIAGLPTPFDEPHFDQTQDADMWRDISDRLNELSEDSDHFLFMGILEMVKHLVDSELIDKHFKKSSPSDLIEIAATRNAGSQTTIHASLYAGGRELNVKMIHSFNSNTLIFQPDSGREMNPPEAESQESSPWHEVHTNDFIGALMNRVAISPEIDLSKFRGFGGLERMLELSRSQGVSIKVSETPGPLRLMEVGHARAGTRADGRVINLMFQAGPLRESYRLGLLRVGEKRTLRLLKEEGQPEQRSAFLRGPEALKIIQHIEAATKRTGEYDDGARLAGSDRPEAEWISALRATARDPRLHARVVLTMTRRQWHDEAFVEAARDSARRVKNLFAPGRVDYAVRVREDGGTFNLFDEQTSAEGATVKTIYVGPMDPGFIRSLGERNSRAQTPQDKVGALMTDPRTRPADSEGNFSFLANVLAVLAASPEIFSFDEAANFARQAANLDLTEKQWSGISEVPNDPQWWQILRSLSWRFRPGPGVHSLANAGLLDSSSRAA